MKSSYIISVCLVSMVCHMGIARANTIEDLQHQIQAMEARHQAEMAAMQARIAALETARTARLVPATGAQTRADWVESWTWTGDIRLRNESLDRSGEAREDFNRQRLRVRLGIIAQIHEALQAGVRLATGSLTNPRSTNQTFDDTFSKKNFLLDRAYLEYMPQIDGLDQLIIVGGMMANPFWRVSQLLWDTDLSFAGAALRLAQRMGPWHTFANAGIFPVDADGFGGRSPVLWAAQAGASIYPFANAERALLKSMKVTGALAYHDYANTAKQAILNTSGGNTSAAEDFNQFNPSVEIASKVGTFPVAVFYDYVRNTAVDENHEGFHVGLKVGKAKKAFSFTDGWEAGYYFQRLEADAVFDGFPDGDFGGGGTNHRGNVWWVKFATLKNSTLQLKYYNVEELTSTKDHNDTFQIDWVTKF